MTRAMYGGRTTLGIALVVAVCGVIAAAVYGAIGSTLGRLWDYVADPVVSFRNAIPDVPMVMLLGKIFPPGFMTMVVLLVLVNRVGGVRFTRAALLGSGTNSESTTGSPVLSGLSALTVAAAVYAGWAIMVETAVSYLGLGIQPPMPSWGNMLSNAQQYFFSAPWLVFAPGLLIGLAVLSLSLIADGLRRVPAWAGIGR